MQTNTWPLARTTLLEYTHFYLVGIKGVAMTSLAQCLLDAGKQVRGSDLADSFVTQPLLDAHSLSIDTSFDTPLPDETECVIYTSAHHAQKNPQVVAALQRGIPVWTQAEAIASIANQKEVIAVCGVGGKSTISAMIAWILEKAWQDGSIVQPPSYSVGVGSIPGLKQTGTFRQDSRYFVIEADEYVTEPELARTGELHVPRFAYLQPSIIVCPNIRYDHPDVYTSLDHTIDTFRRFFSQLDIKKNKKDSISDAQATLQSPPTLILHSNDDILMTFADELSNIYQVITYGTQNHPDIELTDITFRPGKTKGVLKTKVSPTDSKTTTIPIELAIPGEYNLLNATAALCAAKIAGVAPENGAKYLQEFRSTKRRAEFIGEKNGVRYYDDYAHHPSELSAVIQAFQNWYPNQRVLFAFQPHTYSRTKQLFTEFVQSLSLAREVVLLDIFASARESFDTTISSEMIAHKINARTVHTIPELKEYLTQTLKPGDVCVTLGAGDIYEVHDLISSSSSATFTPEIQLAFPTLSFQENYPLAQKTYFKIGGPAQVYVEIADESLVGEVFAWCTQKNIPVTIFGGASNVLVADEGIQGLVIHLTNNYCELVSNSKTKIQVGAGMKTALLVGKTVQLGLTGLEYFLGVPGTVGGAIYNNAHYLEHLIGTYVTRVKIAQNDGTIIWLSHDQCDFGYDTSRFHTTDEIILAVEFELAPGDTQTSKDLIAEATRYRAQTQPLGAPSSGCIFQNTPNTPRLRELFPQFQERAFVGGGFLIDQAGLKGTTIGGVSVSHKHAAFIVNDGTGTAAQVKELISLIKQEVKKKFGVELKEEVFLLK